jgi:FtsH-binding integral membrane protein
MPRESYGRGGVRESLRARAPPDGAVGFRPLAEYAVRAIPYGDLQGFLQRVFAWMFAGLLIGLFVVQIVVVLVLSAAINRLSVPLAVTLFFVYAALNGVTFAFVFELYTRESIFTTFPITAAMFGTVAVWGYTPKRDLSRLGTVLFMGLVGLILASLVNFFVGGSTLYWITTYAGVLIFSGLTAYDMKAQGLRRAGGPGEQEEGRSALLGALALYLDFINLFLFFLRIFARGR